MYIKTINFNTIISFTFEIISMGVWRQDSSVSSSDETSVDMIGLYRQMHQLNNHLVLLDLLHPEQNKNLGNTRYSSNFPGK